MLHAVISATPFKAPKTPQAGAVGATSLQGALGTHASAVCTDSIVCAYFGAVGATLLTFQYDTIGASLLKAPTAPAWVSKSALTPTSAPAHGQVRLLGVSFSISLSNTYVSCVHTRVQQGLVSLVPQLMNLIRGRECRQLAQHRLRQKAMPRSSCHQGQYLVQQVLLVLRRRREFHGQRFLGRQD